jgi:hypothetical protein
MNKLKPDLERRPIYFYPTEEQCKVRLTQFDTRDILLAKKQGLQPIFLLHCVVIACKIMNDTKMNE